MISGTMFLLMIALLPVLGLFLPILLLGVQ